MYSNNTRGVEMWLVGTFGVQFKYVKELLFYLMT
jgi:hypothetical protein